MSVAELNAECERLNRAFARPCLVHGTRPELFLKVLKKQQLNIPSEREEQAAVRGLSFIDRLVGADDAIFFKSGFSYNSHDPTMTMGFIYRLDMIDSSFDVYQIDIMLHLAKEILRYLRKHEPEQLARIKRQDLREAINEFFKTDDDPEFIVNGIPCGLFKYWLYLNELEHLYRTARCFDDLDAHLLNEKERLSIRILKGTRLSDEYWKCQVRGAEIICHRSISLDDANLIGFYAKNLDESTLAALQQFERQAKRLREPLLLFDGGRTVELKSLQLSKCN